MRETAASKMRDMMLESSKEEAGNSDTVFDAIDALGLKQVQGLNFFSKGQGDYNLQYVPRTNTVKYVWVQDPKNKSRVIGALKKAGLKVKETIYRGNMTKLTVESSLDTAINSIA